MKNLATEIVGAVRSVGGRGPLALHEPTFVGNENRYIQDCLASSLVSTVGNYVERFERLLSETAGVKYAVATVNGTSALHIALILAGVTSGDEVLVPSLTFVATANAVMYCNAIPHFVDCEETTLSIDVDKLRIYLLERTRLIDGACINVTTKRRIRAIVPMHIFGHPVMMNEILEIASDFRLQVVEDAAESLGSTYLGKQTGSFGLLGALSFNGNKIITTGGGGAILTDNPKLALYARHLTTTAKVHHQWEYFHDRLGYNYRMPALNAALGCAQIENLPRLIELKRLLFKRYESAFAQIKGVTLMSEPQNCQSNYWLQTLILDAESEKYRDQILKEANGAGYMMRPTWTPLNKLPHFLGMPSMDLTGTNTASKRVLNIPSSAHLGADFDG